MLKTHQTILQTLLLYLTLIILITTQPPTPSPATSTFFNPPYFSSNFFKFPAGTSYLYDPLNLYPYTFNAPMNTSIINVASVNIVLTSWTSNTNSGTFGFGTVVGYTSMPLTIVNIKFGVAQNCGFTNIGFSVIAISKPYDYYALTIQFLMTTPATPYTQTLGLPASYQWMLLLIDCQVISTDSTQYSFIQSVSASFASTGVTLIFTSSPLTTVYSLRYLLIILDDAPTLPLFNFYAYKFFAVISSIFTSINFNVDPLLYGTDLNPNCIIGYQTLKSMNAVSPQVSFDLTPAGYINGFQNSLANALAMSIFCIRDMFCPPLFPFRIAGDKINCYDCPPGNLLVPTSLSPNLVQTVGLCIQFDPLYMLQHFDPVSVISIGQCYTHCLNCMDNYYQSGGICLPCTFTNCLRCDSVQCLTCTSSLYYITLFTCHICSQLKPNCLTCTTTDCLLCKMDYFATNGNCVLKSTLGVIGCISPMLDGGVSYCLLCDQKGFFVRNASNLCQCANGFILDIAMATCVEICGDGLAYMLACDDGNANNEDGCTEQCVVSTNFQCSITNYVTLCKSINPLHIHIKSIMKNPGQSSAIMTLQASNLIFPYDFSTDQFTSVNKSMISISVNTIKSNISLPCHIISASTNKILISLTYPITIQHLFSTIQLLTQSTLYIQQDNHIVLNQKLIGMNKPLIVSGVQVQIQTIKWIMMIVGGLGMVGFVVGLSARKFIGMEGVVTLQLVYYSQILVSSADKWPLAFQYLTYLKYSFGYNQILDITDFVPDSSFQRKVYFLQMSKTITQNYNISYVILIICFIAFIVSIYLRKRAQNRISNSRIQNKQVLQQKKLSQAKQLKQAQNKLKQLQNKQNTQYILFRILSQISYWCILQVVSSIICRILICNQTLTILSTPVIPQKIMVIHLLQKILPFTSLLIIFFIGLSNYKNLLISNNTWGQIIKRKQQILYKVIMMSYLIIIGVIIGCIGEVKIGSVHMAGFVLLIHLVYLIVVNVVVKPYASSLRIHRYTLFINHLLYLIFLVFINLINFIDQLSQSLMVIFGYFLTGAGAVTVIFTAIRLYYEYRYGQTMQIQVQEQQDLQEQNTRPQNNRIKDYQAEAKKRQLLNGDIPLNKFSFKKQIQEQKKMDLMDWLDKRYHWTKEQKEKYYFQKFADKPLMWLKKQDPQKYKQMTQLEQTQQKLQQKLRSQKIPSFQAQSDRIILKNLRTKMSSQKLQKQKLNNKLTKQKLKKQIISKAKYTF